MSPDASPPLSRASGFASHESSPVLRHDHTTPPCSTTTPSDPAILHTLLREEENASTDPAPLATTARTAAHSPTRRAGTGNSAGGRGGGENVSSNPAHEVTTSLRLGETSSAAGSSDRNSVISWSNRSSMEHSRVMAEGNEQQQQHIIQPNRMDSSLPENDGMSALRDQLHEIRKLAISTEEKAMKMHLLMTQTYLAHRTDLSTSPISLGDSATMLIDEPAALDVGLAALPIDPSNPFNLRPGDTDISYSPLPPSNHHDGDLTAEEEEHNDNVPDLGCMHYKRNVKIQCFDCHRWFPCRHCHDQAQDLPFPHTLRRKLTRNMLCMLCSTPQPAAESCFGCGEYAAWYYCDKCKLWDNDSNKRIYHCDDCGICRVGEGLGKDYVHCKKCGVCISISTSAAHPCIEGATMGDCPLCLDKMFESRSSVVSLPCGHYMHGICFKDLMAATYRCPVCSKSAVNMELQWRKLDDEIRAQPMPDDDADFEGLLPPTSEPSTHPRRPRTVWIGCNDCSGRCWTSFHWLGLKCQNCDSYNTTQMAPTASHETEAERLIRQQGFHRHHDFTGLAVWADAGIHRDDAAATRLLDIPSSPSHLARSASPGSPSSSAGLPSPRRYFVQHDDDPPRRPSFTSRGFSTPTLPHYLPEMPRLPRMPNLPNMPNIPNLPNLPNIPNLPNLPNIPNLPNMPNMVPNMPPLNLDLMTGGLPRFSPYDMFDSLSRSLSPMRYYLQGLDMRDDGLLPARERLRAGDSRARSADAAAGGKVVKDGRGGQTGGVGREDDDDDEDFWEDEVEVEGLNGLRSEGKEDDDEDADGEESESGSESGSGSEDDEDDVVEEEDDIDMDLFGHR